MSSGSPRLVIVLDPIASLGALPGKVMRHCGSATEAREVLELRGPDALVIDCGVQWHHGIAERARAKGIAVVAVGTSPEPDAGMLVDEWIQLCVPDRELNTRLDLAVARARERRREARRTNTDVLTGLPNRRALIRSAIHFAAHARRTGEAIGLILIDLDHFKEVNDRFGHPAGDRLLRRVASVLRREVRQGEVCGRIGGDEFAVVLRGGFREATLACDRLIEALNGAGVSASGGFAVSREGGGLRNLYPDADLALMRSKRLRYEARAPSKTLRRKEVEASDQLSFR